MSNITVDAPRSTPRTVYYQLRRFARIAHRDSQAAMNDAITDMMIFGSGAVLVEPFDGPKGQFAKVTRVKSSAKAETP